uniref:(northern house mosquito) hypothetical protein n=1 Tax=Culex pipiens TaxID=7175 RepID=A0A8D8P3N7_CULPI
MLNSRLANNVPSGVWLRWNRTSNEYGSCSSCTDGQFTARRSDGSSTTPALVGQPVDNQQVLGSATNCHLAPRSRTDWRSPRSPQSDGLPETFHVEEVVSSDRRKPTLPTDATSVPLPRSSANQNAES